MYHVRRCTVELKMGCVCVTVYNVLRRCVMWVNWLMVLLICFLWSYMCQWLSKYMWYMWDIGHCILLHGKQFLHCEVIIICWAPNFGGFCCYERKWIVTFKLCIYRGINLKGFYHLRYSMAHRFLSLSPLKIYTFLNPGSHFIDNLTCTFRSSV